MWVNLSVAPSLAPIALSPVEQDAPRPTLLARVDALAARGEVLAAENATLLARVDALVARVAVLESENAAFGRNCRRRRRRRTTLARRPRRGARRTAMARRALRPGCTPARTGRCIPTRPVARWSGRSTARTAAPT